MVYKVIFYLRNPSKKNLTKPLRLPLSHKTYKGKKGDIQLIVFGFLFLLQSLRKFYNMSFLLSQGACA
jgi:hypothetical protein